MKEVTHYSTSWRTEDNSGTIQLALADGSGGTLEPNSPQEAMLLLDILRNEKPVYFCSENLLLMTGVESVGEGEEND